MWMRMRKPFTLEEQQPVCFRDRTEPMIVTGHWSL